MIERIEIKPETWQRYKADTFIDPGTYFATSARLPDQLRRAVGATAAVGPGGRFKWLLPCENWVRTLIQQYEPDELRYYGQADLNDLGTVRAILSLFRLTPDLWSKLRNWQRAELADAAVCLDRTKQYRRGRIAPLGAGKTLAGLCLANRTNNAVVIAPTHLHDSWRNEAAKWGLSCPRVSTYESSHKLDSADTVICDEVLALKNPKTQRHEKVAKLAERASVVVGYTATPSSVAPYDLRWLRAINPGSVPFEETCWRHLFGLDTRLEDIPGRGGAKAWVTNVWDMTALTKFTAPYVASVPLSEIAGELPPVQYQTIHVPTPRRYGMILRGAAADTKMKALAQARQVTDGFIYDNHDVPVTMDDAKLNALAEIVDGSDEPVVVFAAWSASVEAIAARFEHLKPAVLSGEHGDYGSQIARFVDGSTRLLVANARISTGMNLQRCGRRNTRVMVFYSNSLNPVDRIQAEGRIVRPGNQSSGVVIYDLICRDTLDAATVKLLREHAAEGESIIAAALEREFERQVKEVA